MSFLFVRTVACRVPVALIKTNGHRAKYVLSPWQRLMNLFSGMNLNLTTSEWRHTQGKRMGLSLFFSLFLFSLHRNYSCFKKIGFRFKPKWIQDCNSIFFFYVGFSLFFRWSSRKKATIIYKDFVHSCVYTIRSYLN